MQFMDESHYDTLLDEDVSVYRPDGEPLLFLIKGAISPSSAAAAWTALKTINGGNKNRSTAIGTAGRPYKNTDGRLSKQILVPKEWQVISDIVGSFDRSVRFPFARFCAWNSKNPQLFTHMFPMLHEASVLFQTLVPDRFKNQIDFCKKTDPSWIIPGTPYTTLTVNKNFRTACHQDAGDLKSGFSNMIVIRQGKWRGANLVLPNWRIAVKLDHLDLVMFDPHEWHGNTKLITLTKDAVRCSVVCYFREKLVLCGPPEYELQQAKNRKPGQPIYWEKP